jgi:hypothetical protein
MYYPLKRKNFLEKIKQSSEQRQIVYYFCRHRHACETLEDLAYNLGKKPEDIESAVHDLEQMGVLHNCGPLWGNPFYANSYTEFYSLAMNEELDTILLELERTQTQSS